MPVLPPSSLLAVSILPPCLLAALQLPLLLCARDVARGMAYLHSLNITHGDLKAVSLTRHLLPPPAAGVRQVMKP
jgi:hypothetical protein